MTVIDDQKLDVAPTNDHGVKRRWWWSWPIEPVQGGRRGDDQAIGDLVVEQATGDQGDCRAFGGGQFLQPAADADGGVTG
ncbi:hypothetical protein [Streptomyces ardesiacus]|uniref:hypothetical protein n=1 Tax=Streptomyces ardesiacus TaxID=285564 RepID=UPI0036EC6414